MKILLVGEYSRLHNSLKEGLVKLGHEVIIVGSGDYFKKFPVDLKLEASFFNTSFGNLIRQAVFRITGYDLASFEILYKFGKLKPKLSGFDVVQLINESPFGTTPKAEMQMISFLKNHNKKLFLLSCGDDYTSVSFAMKKTLKYSIFTPLFSNPEYKKDYAPFIKYIQPKFKALHEFIVNQVNGIIASDLDYHMPLQGHPKYLGMIANPINIETIRFKPLEINSKINLFLGINSVSALKKGVPIFKRVLNRLQENHSEKIKIITVEDLPYSGYIKKLEEAHIILDQVYSYDQGYNALEAMAKGKVVCTGAETEFYSYYNLKEQVVINATPDENELYKTLENLIVNQDQLMAISKAARQFIVKEHDYMKVAKQYVKAYLSSSEVSETS